MGSNLVIVALPANDDPVWKVSSEKQPHMTLLFLGDAESNPNVDRIMQFVYHAVNVSEHGPFYLDVDRRDVLGEDKADVIHFRKKDWSLKWVEQFRHQLLQNTDIRAAYDSVEQFPEWRPHLTLGYPETPAHEEKMPEHGLHMVHFDRIAVWTGNYEGPWFRLEWTERESELVVAYSNIGKTAVEELLHDGESERGTSENGAVFSEGLLEGLTHYGIKGMRWGQRSSSPPSPVAPQAMSKVPHGAKRKTKIEVEGGENHPAADDAIKVAQARAKLAKSGPASLSNKELQEIASRVELEQRVKRVTQPGAQKFVTNLLRTQGNQAANQAANQALQKQVKKQFA